MLNGKVIVVLGGCGLLGQQFCEAIASQGGIVVVADIDLERAEVLARSICDTGGSASAQLVDMTKQRSLSALIEVVSARNGGIDAVVNNAYPRIGNYGCILEDVTYEDFCGNLSAHLGGYFLVAQQFAKYFNENGGGNIINMGSIYGLIAPDFSVYNGTTMTMPVEYAAIKSGVAHITRYFAQYYKKKGIRVNTLSPGGILDSQQELFINNYSLHSGKKGMLEGKDIVGTLIYLLSDLSKYVNGQNIVVDDGYSL